MDRLSFRVSEDNKRRIEILQAFSVLDGRRPTMQELVNQSIELFFITVYRDYCSTHRDCDLLSDTMKGMLPEDDGSAESVSED